MHLGRLFKNLLRSSGAAQRWHMFMKNIRLSRENRCIIGVHWSIECRNSLLTPWYQRRLLVSCNFKGQQQSVQIICENTSPAMLPVLTNGSLPGNHQGIIKPWSTALEQVYSV